MGEEQSNVERREKKEASMGGLRGEEEWRPREAGPGGGKEMGLPERGKRGENKRGKEDEKGLGWLDFDPNLIFKVFLLPYF